MRKLTIIVIVNREVIDTKVHPLISPSPPPPPPPHTHPQAASRKKHISSQSSRETEEYDPSSPKSLTEDDSGGVDPEITAEEYKAIEDYEADGPGQVSFKEGDIIQVMDKLEDGKVI